MMPPKNRKQVCAFIFLVKSNRDNWAMRSHLLQPLAVIQSNKVKFKWADIKH